MKKMFKISILIPVILIVVGCKKFIEIDPPKSSITPTAVFRNDDLAISAMLGIYQQMAASGYAAGDANSISTLCGTTADELIGYSTAIVPFYENRLLPENTINASTWTSIYARIYNLNTFLEGINGEHNLSLTVASQLEGEAMFSRAFHYFYLINLFGDVPLYLTTDYQANSKKPRSPVGDIYKQIILDLKLAESKIAENYISTERIRPNKSTVQALLAKVYLYMGDWQSSERYSSMVIEKTNLYDLVAIDDVFLKNSKEAIWQLMPTAGGNTSAGNLLILTTTPNTVSLRPDFVQSSFETGDLRRNNWVRNLTVQGVNYYYPFKYKIRSSTTVTEYFMVLRLAEMFLIRAESRAKQNRLSLAIDDLDRLRSRAGLALIKITLPDISKEVLLEQIQKERRVELFTEWGNRWFDLKRNQKTTEVLAPIKPGWQATSILFPIPKLEIDNNSKITQNEGY